MRNFNITENDYQLIEDFFDRNLDEVDLIYFENRLKEDPDFARQVDLYEYAQEKILALYEPAQKSNENEFKARLNHLKEKEQSPFQKKMVFTILGVAATIALLFFVNLPFLNSTISTETSIAQADFRGLQVNTDEMLTNSSRATEEGGQDEPYQGLLEAFKTKEYSTVLQIANQLEESDIEAVQLIIGIAYRKEGQIAQAVAYLEKVKGQRDIALWNLVTLYLEQNPIDKENARKYLKILIEEGFNSREEAERILDNL